MCRLLEPKSCPCYRAAEAEETEMSDRLLIERLSAETAHLRSSHAELLKAAKEYKTEVESPVSDWVMRRSARDRLWKAIANAQECEG